MPRITPVSTNLAQGNIKEGYEMYLSRFGTIPKPIEMLSVSPGLFDIQLKRNHYLATQSNLSFSLLAHIRYLAACHLTYAFCKDFNKELIKRQGATEEDIRRMEKDPAQSLLEDNESAMLVFVVKALKDPSSITDEDITGLRSLGWTDKDMVEAMTQGVSMIDHAVMMQVFDMDSYCLANG